MINQKKDIIVAALILLILFAPVAPAIASALTHQSTQGVTYQTNSGLEVTLNDQREISATPFPDNQTWEDSNLSLSSGSGAEISISDTSFNTDTVSVSEVAASASEITINRADVGELDLSGEYSLFEFSEYDAKDNTTDISYSSSTGGSVTLRGLEGNIGIAAVDQTTGEPLDSNVTSSSGEITFELPGGQYDVRLEEAPAELEVRNEANPSELVDSNVSIRARFFAGENEEEVVERTVTNGTVSLAGLPVDEEIVITAREENANYTYRRIIINSVIETQEIFLLPASIPSAQIRFRLQDQTGRFEPSSTKLFIEKPITRANKTEYAIIAGDTFGAAGEFPVDLVNEERYRLRVVNEEGERRILGAYTVSGSAVEPLPIGEVEFTDELDSGVGWQASVRESPAGANYDHEARLVYVDTEGTTDELDVSITDQDGNELHNVSETDVDRYVETVPLPDSFDPDSETATATADIVRGSETKTLSRTIGALPDIIKDAPIDPDILKMIGWVSIVAVIGLLIIASPELAAVVGVGWAALLSMVGIVPIPTPYILFSGTLAVLFSAGKRSV